MKDLLEIIGKYLGSVLEIFLSNFSGLSTALQFDFVSLGVYLVVMPVAGYTFLAILIFRPNKIVELPFNPILFMPISVFLWSLMMVIYFCCTFWLGNLPFRDYAKIFASAMPTAGFLTVLIVSAYAVFRTTWGSIGRSLNFNIGRKFKIFFPYISSPIYLVFYTKIGVEVNLGLLASALFSIVFTALSLLIGLAFAARKWIGRELELHEEHYMDV